MIGISHKLDNPKDIVLRRQCGKCKEIVTQVVLNGFVDLDSMSRLSIATWERLKVYSNACFEEEHKCTTT